MNRHLLDLKMRLESADGADIYQFVLFPTFVIHTNAQTLEVAVNERFAFLLNSLDSDFTRFELAEFTSLKSSYSKCLYRLLKQYRTTGYVRITTENLRTALAVPESYQNKTMNHDIIKPAVNELRPLFNSLRMHAVKQRRQGAPIMAYEFLFVPEQVPEQREQQKFTRPQPKQTCPICGQPLYQRNINGNIAWVHTDGAHPDAPCSALFNSVADIQGYDEQPTRDHSNDPLPGQISILPADDLSDSDRDEIRAKIAKYQQKFEKMTD